MKQIIVNTIEDLDSLRFLEKGEYYIMLNSNLDFDEEKYYKDKKNYHLIKKYGFEPINLKSTNIIFNGDDFAILNLIINKPDTNDIGLFNTYDGALVLIKNLKITGFVVGRKNVGLIGGKFNGIINNCDITYSNVKGISEVGGLVGLSGGKLLLNDTKIGTINAYSEEEKKCGIVAGKCNKISINLCMYNYPDDSLVGSFQNFDIIKKQSPRRFLKI